MRRPRIVIDVSPDIEERLNKFLLWGDRSAFFRFLIEDVLNVLESSPENARLILAAYMTRKIGLQDLSPMMKTKEESEDET